MSHAVTKWIVMCIACSFIAPVLSGDAPEPKTEKVTAAGGGAKDAKNGATEAPKDGPDYPRLFKDLTSEDATARQTAAKALIQSLDDLVQKSDKPYLKKIQQDVNAEKAEVKDPAVSRLAGALDQMRNANVQAFGVLLEKLKSGDTKVRDDARQMLCENLSAVMEVQIIDHYIDDLGAADEAVRASAAKQLQTMGADAASSLVSALDDERLAVKKGAADVLKAMGPGAKDVAGDLALLLDNDDKAERKLAASVLENLGPDAADAVSDLVNYLDHEEKPVRRLATNVLKKIGAPVKEASSDLINYLSDEDKNTRACAEEVLVNLGAEAKEGVPGLIELIEDDAQDADTHRRAVTVLASIGKDAKKAVDALKKRQASGADDLKATIGDALKKIDVSDADPKAENKTDTKTDAAPKPDAK